MEQATSLPLENLTNTYNREITDSYDKRVYTSNAFPYSSPGHLQAAAYLYGLPSVPLKNARILELGCAGGGNLLPFAVSYPDANIVGVDLSTIQIEQGKAAIEALKLTNIKLYAMSLTDLDASFGQFDYIIVHGVFSWVPPEVRHAIFSLIRNHLTAEGIAYISYNTYPGWKAGDIVRDAMLLHSHNSVGVDNKLAAAKAMLNLLSDGIANSNPLAASLRSAVKQLEKHSEYYIAHEYLEHFNNPCYLLEFASMAQEFTLSHVGDSEPHLEMSANYGQNVQLNHSLIALGQPRIIRQQYLDFAIGRNFRKSLVVQQERDTDIAISPKLENLSDFRWAGYFQPTNSAVEAPKTQLSFLNHKNRLLQTNEDSVLAVIKSLTAVWPRSLSFNELLKACCTYQAEFPPQQLQEEILQALKTLFHSNALRYSLEPSPYDKNAMLANPKIIPGMAWLYEQRKNADFGIGLFNLWHESVFIELNNTQIWLLPHINGSNTRKQLSILLRDALHKGVVTYTDGKSKKGQRNLDSIAENAVIQLLDFLKKHALLV